MMQAQLRYTRIPDVQFSSEIQFKHNFLKQILKTLNETYAQMC